MKKRLPAVRAAPADARARERLARWLREWNIDRALESAADALPPAPSAGRPARGGRRGPLRAGEVRLLRPDTGTGGERPRYFLVLDAPAAGPVRVAPFSRFGAPAIPGEWRTGHPAPALGVLCLWNALDLPRAAAERSWPVADFGATRLAAARRVATAYVAPDQSPGEGADDAGPPLSHPDDPRWRYLEEEARAWEHLGGETAEPPSRPLVLRDRAVPYGAGPEPALPLAAEPQPEYGAPGRKPGRKRERK